MLDFKNDIQSEKIKELAMLGCKNEVIKNNTYAYMFNVWRKIVAVHEDYFETETYYIDGTKTTCEAYYNAFTKYTGNSVSNGNVFYAVR